MVNNDSGVILINVIIILLMIAVIGASLMTFFFSVSLFARAITDGAKAFYLAEGGISYGIHILKSSAVSDLEFQEFGPIGLGEGVFSVTIDYRRSLITSMGLVNGVDKTVQLQFSAL